MKNGFFELEKSTKPLILKITLLMLVGNLLTPLNAQVPDWYFTVKNGWQMSKHVRTMGDINGDGKDDIVGFGGDGVFVSFSEGNGRFSEPKMMLKSFAINAGNWQVNRHPRMVADVNGDGRADLIGINDEGVLVSLSGGIVFTPPVLWLKHSFTSNNGWNVREHVRTMADVNGDGKADIVGFGGNAVYVALCTGSKFAEPTKWYSGYAIGHGAWTVTQHTRIVTDINKDKKADIVGFGGELYISFAESNKFGQQTKLGFPFFTLHEKWNLKKRRRLMGDINGDGMADIIALLENKIFYALANGNGFSSKKKIERGDYTVSQGWSPEKYPVLVGDVNGDGKDDLIGFKEQKGYVSFANGQGFDSPIQLSFTR